MWEKPDPSPAPPTATPTPIAGPYALTGNSDSYLGATPEGCIESICSDGYYGGELSRDDSLALAETILRAPGAKDPKVFSAQAFLEAVANAPGPIGHVPVGIHGALPVEPSYLCVVSNYEPIYDLFKLAAQVYLIGRETLHEIWGRTCVTLSWGPGVKHEVLAHVAWQGADGFAIADAGRQITFGPGTILVTWGSQAVGILGFVKGRPLAVFVPESTDLVDLPRLGYLSTLIARARERT